MDIVLGFAVIGAFFGAAAALIIHCNLDYWSERKRMTAPQRREADDELWIW